MSAWTVIAHTEVGSGGASSISFMSVGDIPSSYTDLVMVYSIRPTNTLIEGVYVSFNGSTSNFSARFLEGNGSSASSGTSIPRYIGAFQGTTADTFSNGQLYIPNYRSSVAKSWSVDNVTEANQTGAYQDIIAGLWNDTAAITSITLTLYTNNFGQYSSATLYGITKGSSGGVTVS
jgi:hypothetical protein